jgi:ferredoxin
MAEPGDFARVWIEEGCISCNLCEDICSEVFQVPAGETSQVKEGAETFFRKLADRIQEAVDSCPVEVIKAERTGPVSSLQRA